MNIQEGRTGQICLLYVDRDSDRVLGSAAPKGWRCSEFSEINVHFCQKNINIQQARKSDKTNNFPKLDFQAYKSLKCAAKPAVNVRPNTLSSLSH